MLLGTTVRMAQSLGIHQERKTPSSQVTEDHNKKLWSVKFDPDFYDNIGAYYMFSRLAVIWQDTLLSLCFDRPPAATTIPYKTDVSMAMTYSEAMYCLFEGILKGISLQGSFANNPVPILSNVENIESIRSRVAGHLKGVAGCSNIRQRCEYYALSLHIAFVVAWLCRPALRNRSAYQGPENIRRQLADKCKMNLLESIRSYVQLHSLSILASRSWAIMHNALSSALLLGLIGATKTDPSVRYLQGQIIDILSNGPVSEGEQQSGDPRVELSKSHARALTVLKSLYDDPGERPVTAVYNSASYRISEAMADSTIHMRNDDDRTAKGQLNGVIPTYLWNSQL